MRGHAVNVQVARRGCNVAIVNDRGNEMKRERFYF